MHNSIPFIKKIQPKIELTEFRLKKFYKWKPKKEHVEIKHKCIEALKNQLDLLNRQQQKYKNNLNFSRNELNTK